MEANTLNILAININAKAMLAALNNLYLVGAMFICKFKNLTIDHYTIIKLEKHS